MTDQELINEANFRTRFRVHPYADIDMEDWVPEMGWEEEDYEDEDE